MFLIRAGQQRAIWMQKSNHLDNLPISRSLVNMVGKCFMGSLWQAHMHNCHEIRVCFLRYLTPQNRSFSINVQKLYNIRGSRTLCMPCFTPYWPHLCGLFTPPASQPTCWDFLLLYITAAPPMQAAAAHIATYIMPLFWQLCSLTGWTVPQVLLSHACGGLATKQGYMCYLRGLRSLHFCTGENTHWSWEKLGFVSYTCTHWGEPMFHQRSAEAGRNLQLWSR